MPDHSSELLLEAISSDDRAVLWVVDEDTDVATLAAAGRTGLQLMTNRYDQYQTAQAAGLRVLLADYDLAPAQPLPPVIAHRVAKQKAAVHYLINQVAQSATVGGELWLAGARDEGIKTYCAKASAALGGKPVLGRGRGGAQLARIACGSVRGESLPDDHYDHLRLAVRDGELEFLSKPGIYGWNKVDAGSRLLGNHLATVAGQVDAIAGGHTSVLDLGCGYGYLAIRAALTLAAVVTATDNNLAAVAACRANFDRFGIDGAVVLDDAATNIGQRFDLVLCNPPFHQGFETRGTQTDKFLAAAASRLAPAGLALFVVNRFIPLSRKAAQFSLYCDQVAEDTGFRVFALRHAAR